ncbi:hypothetical protein ACOSQ2_003983 [Xanthoceras sorbifolium]
MVDIWLSKEWQNKSTRNKCNHGVDAIVVHASGSVPIAKYRKKEVTIILTIMYLFFGDCNLFQFKYQLLLALLRSSLLITLAISDQILVYSKSNKCLIETLRCSTKSLRD